ncbi:hypothetical protein ETD85_49830 [Nonomuraea zeae]|uniref:Alpha/beta hydrolase n=1 Tax=Nonomuraea zeae TaxID=1642303 RepID=A0A5S4FN44_9ACTN|nr:hypothetical protein ETD85_49830 [Nonomuraea zeae]
MSQSTRASTRSSSQRTRVSAADGEWPGWRSGTVKVYPGAAHAINGEPPGEIAADLAAFLAAS